MFTEKYSSHVGTFRAVNLKIGTACVATNSKGSTLKLFSELYQSAYIIVHAIDYDDYYPGLHSAVFLCY